MSLVLRKPVFGYPTRSDTNRALQPHKMARGLKFRIYEVEGLYYPCSENKDADQLCGYREADLRLCFRICKNPVFSRRGSIMFTYFAYSFQMGLLKKNEEEFLIQYNLGFKKWLFHFIF